MTGQVNEPYLYSNGRFKDHGPACSADPDATHRFALADTGWWCRGCKNKVVTLIQPVERCEIGELPVPTCEACLTAHTDAEERAMGLVITIRPDSRTEPA